jgi:hypothetical protein
MPVKRRTTKRGEELSESAQKWLRGEPSGFFEFKDANELAALWAEYGDPKVAVWDDAAQMPRARSRQLLEQARPVQNDSAGLRTTGDFFATVVRGRRHL